MTQRISEGKPGLFSHTAQGVLIRTAPLDNLEQIVVSESFRVRVLDLNHHSAISGHLGGRRKYSKMRKRVYWAAMAVDVYRTVRQCKLHMKELVQVDKRTKALKLFPATEPLTSVAADLLGPFPKTTSGEYHILAITDRYSKLTRLVPLGSTMAPILSRASWNIEYLSVDKQGHC